MATPVKRWPNEMAAVRDESAEVLVAAVRTLEPLITHRDDVVKARAGVTLAHIQRALRLLEYAGAATRPTNG